MPAPAMPITMRGDGRGTRVLQKKVTTRYFAGKGEDRSDEEDDEDEDEDIADADAEKDIEATEDDSETIHESRLDTSNHSTLPQVRATTQSSQDAFEPAEDSADEYETDSQAASGSESEEEEEEEPRRRVLLKPTFISKSQRSQILTSKTSAATTAPTEGSHLDEQQKERLEARKMLQHSIRQAAAAAAGPAGDFVGDGDEVDDTDEPSEAAYEAWTLRELRRIKRDRDALEARERERGEIDARRAVPEDVRLKEDVERVQRERQEKIDARRAEREEAGGAGQQAYHHRGGFYQDDPVVKRRLEGVVERTGAGQGLKGAVKRTGLLSQDSSRDSIWHDDSRDRSLKRPMDGMDGTKGTVDQERKRRA